MGKLMKYQGRYKLQCLLVLVLLVVQAVCDLALPDYTADIVDTGIMQKGVDRVSPAVISGESMDSVKLFMKEDEYAYVKDCYDLVDSVKDTDALPLKDKTARAIRLRCRPYSRAAAVPKSTTPSSGVILSRAAGAQRRIFAACHASRDRTKSDKSCRKRLCRKAAYIYFSGFAGVETALNLPLPDGSPRHPRLCLGRHPPPGGGLPSLPGRGRPFCHAFVTIFTFRGNPLVFSPNL